MTEKGGKEIPDFPYEDRIALAEARFPSPRLTEGQREEYAHTILRRAEHWVKNIEILRGRMAATFGGEVVNRYFSENSGNSQQNNLELEDAFGEDVQGKVEKSDFVPLLKSPIDDDDLVELYRAIEQAAPVMNKVIDHVLPLGRGITSQRAIFAERKLAQHRFYYELLGDRRNEDFNDYELPNLNGRFFVSINNDMLAKIEPVKITEAQKAQLVEMLPNRIMPPFERNNQADELCNLDRWTKGWTHVVLLKLAEVDKNFDSNLVILNVRKKGEAVHEMVAIYAADRPLHIDEEMFGLGATQNIQIGSLVHVREQDQDKSPGWKGWPIIKWFFGRRD